MKSHNLDLKQGISYLEREGEGGGERQREKERVRHKEREGDRELIIKITGKAVLPN